MAMNEYAPIGSVALGRHTDIVEESICSRAAKKEVLINQQNDSTDLFVRTVCDGCGTIKLSRHKEHAIIEDLDEDEQ